jgi:hypothetical protein
MAEGFKLTARAVIFGQGGLSLRLVTDALNGTALGLFGGSLLPAFPF